MIANIVNICKDEKKEYFWLERNINDKFLKHFIPHSLHVTANKRKINFNQWKYFLICQIRYSSCELSW